MDFTIYILEDLKAKLERQCIFYSEQVGNGLLIASEIVEDYIERLEGEE